MTPSSLTETLLPWHTRGIDRVALHVDLTILAPLARPLLMPEPFRSRRSELLHSRLFLTGGFVAAPVVESHRRPLIGHGPLAFVRRDGLAAVNAGVRFVVRHA